MPRYVILTHDHPFPHWDFMLEEGNVLRTWRLMSEPRLFSIVDAEPLPDHRAAYLDYEGPVSGGRGAVRRWDAGAYELIDEVDARWIVRLHGRRGLVLATLQQNGAITQWRFTAETHSPERQT